MLVLTLRHRLLCAVGALALHQACNSDDPPAAPPASQSGQGGSLGGNGGATTAGTNSLGGAGAAQAGAGAAQAGAGAAQVGAGMGGAGVGGVPSAGQAGAGVGGAGQAGAGQGGAGGAGNGTGGAGVGGNQGGTGAGGSVCGVDSSYEQVQKICYGLDGKSTELLTNNPYEGMWGPSCTGLVRKAGDPCPGPEVFQTGCGLIHCSVRDIIPKGPPTASGDACCYDSTVCLGASGCGRPLVVAGLGRRSALAARGDWG